MCVRFTIHFHIETLNMKINVIIEIKNGDGKWVQESKLVNIFFSFL